MNYSQVKELIGLIDKSSLREFELNMENTHMKMSKNSVAITGMESAAAQGGIPAVVSEPITILPEEILEEKAGNVVTSPIVGIFYTGPSPDKPPYKKVGDKVAVGEILCIIEAMKVMNEITSQHNGVIEEIMVQNGSEVEYGQPLFRIV